MLGLATTVCDDLDQDMLEAMHEVDELLRALVKCISCPLVEVDCAFDDLILLLFDVCLSFLQLILSDILQ